ncbi:MULTISPECIES: peptidoglycan-binding protein [unclassified Streptomyces]|uniref:peptidoglycan-binding protein n=1 Tax=unclassified Streptomyces TaxID=2593676 RepID=UPI00224F32D3|nr:MULTISPECIES: peptidoglycan-binding protein [unclassified Streptomyces]MCX4991239.1 peptidoglycan-binding protein [Streptomyces sp. NBC_00568]MCX5003524.1 peptidoglycan-binding protein [Streptomyces sp. NBC_00638]
MTEPTGHVCPECAAHRAQDGTPSCACTSRASDALRDARTAEAAATEDFNPLRIRPYVELGPERSGHPGGGQLPGANAGHPDQAAPGDPGPAAWTAEAGSWAPEGASTPLDGPGAPPHGTAPVNGDDTWPNGVTPAGGIPMPPANGEDAASSTMRLNAVPADATMRLNAVPADATRGPATVPADATMRLKALPSEARATDVRLFQDRSPEPGSGAPASDRPGRGRRTGVIAVAGVVVTMVAAAGFASGLLSYDTPARDGALPKDVRASAPEVLSDKTSGSPSASTSATSSAPSAPASSLSASPSPSASESDTSASPSRSATSAPASTSPSAKATPTGSVASTGSGSNGVSAQTLRRGDSGPEVTELQLRMTQLRMYMRNADGRFDRRLEDAVRWYQWARGISGDEPGVYGTATRASLEAETTEP